MSGKFLEGTSGLFSKKIIFQFWGHLLVTLLKKKTVVFRTKTKIRPLPRGFSAQLKRKVLYSLLAWQLNILFFEFDL
jgi:hypothetical protein